MMNSMFVDLLKGVKKVTLVGYYGANNFGDDIMMMSIVNELRKYCIDISIIGVGPIDWIYGDIEVFYFRPNNPIGNFITFQKAIRNSSVVMWGGGTCFTDEDADGLFNYMLYAKLRIKKIFYVGVGIGNLNILTRKAKAIILINLSSYISFRDHKSFKKGRQWCFSNSLKLIKTDDPANRFLQLVIQSIPKRKECKEYGVISWRNLDKYNLCGKKIDMVALYCLQKLCEKHGLSKLVVIDADSKEDSKIAMKLIRFLKDNSNGIEIIYDNTKSYINKLIILKNARIIMTSRLHVAIAAHYLEKRCFAYNYSPKIESFVNETADPNITLIGDLNLLIKK